MAGLFDYLFGGQGVLANSAPAGEGDTAPPPPMAPPGAGFTADLGARLNNPLVLFGLGLASGKTPGEGFGNALGAQLAQQRLAQANLTGDIREYQYARSQGYQGSFQDWIKSQSNLKSQYGLQPYYTQTPEGALEAWQLNSQGPARKIELPAGVVPAPTNRTINTPTGVQVIPNRGLPGQGGFPGQQPTTSATDDTGRPIVPESGSTLGTPPASPGYYPKDLQSPARIKMDEQAVAPLAKQLAQSRATLPLLDQVIDLANKTPGGWAGPITAEVSRAVAGLGIPVTEGMSNAELMTSITRQLVPGVREPGSTSEYEQRMYIAAVPGIAQSPEGRVKVAEMNKAMIQRRAEIVATYRKYVGSPQLDEKLAEIDRRPMFSKEQQREIAANSPPIRVNSPDEARKYPSGTRIITPDGRQGVVP